MTHDLYRELLQRELDDDLSADELAMLEAHVNTCADCRLEREEYQSLSFGFSKLSGVMPEKSFVPQLELEVRRAVKAHRRTRMVPVWWRSATAAAVVVLAVGLVGYWQFAGKGGSDGRVALDTSRSQLKADTQDAKQSPPTQSAHQDAGKEPANPPMSEPPKEQAAPAVTPKTEPVPPKDTTPARVPQQNILPADGANTIDRLQEPTQEQHTTATTPPSTNEKPGPLIGGQMGSGGATVSTAPADAKGISGGTGSAGIGIMGGMQGEPTPQIGKTPAMTNITPNLQKAVHDGDKTAQWATDSALVVDHAREQLGFRTDAAVSKTARADRVRIVQDGMEFEVRLEQPFDKGTQGIWRPVQVGRLIDQSAPDSLQRPIVDYFRNKSIALHGELMIISVFDEQARTMLVAADVVNNGVEQVRQYLCKLQLDAEGAHWELAGSPIEQ